MSALSAAAAALLPNAADAPRCSDHHRGLGIDPGGSAIDADLLLLIDTPLPWPAQMHDHQLLVGLGPDIDLAAGSGRIVAVVPPDEPTPARMRVLWREGASLGGVRFEFSDGAELDAHLRQLDHVHPRDAKGVHVDHAAATNTVLVCGHGSRDQCCGTDGTRLAFELQRARPDLVVERTSHLGGHRFSPTAMTLPEGRMWAHLDLPTLLAILDRDIEPAAISHLCRGWWGAAMGPAQMAERATFARHGWIVDDSDRVVHELGDHIFEVRWDRGRDRFRVTTAREVPTISCRSLGGLPAKPGVEYTVSDA